MAATTTNGHSPDDPVDDVPQRNEANSAALLADWLSSAVSRIGAITSAVAGSVALMYAVGGAVMWIRFRRAGLPADQAVALVPRNDLMVVGLRVLVLPALLAGGVFLGLALRQCRRHRADIPANRDSIMLKLSLGWLVAIAALVLVVPLTPGALAWPCAALTLWLVWHHSLSTSYRPVDQDRQPFPLWRAAI